MASCLTKLCSVPTMPWSACGQIVVHQSCSWAEAGGARQMARS